MFEGNREISMNFHLQHTHITQYTAHSTPFNTHISPSTQPTAHLSTYTFHQIHSPQHSLQHTHFTKYTAHSTAFNTQISPNTQPTAHPSTHTFYPIHSPQHSLQHTHFTQYTAQKRGLNSVALLSHSKSSLWPVHVVWQLQCGGYLVSCNKLCGVKIQNSMTEDLNLQQHFCRNFRSCKRVSHHEQSLSRLRHSTVPVILSALHRQQTALS